MKISVLSIPEILQEAYCTHAVEALASCLEVQAAYGPGLWAITQIFDNLRESSSNRNNDKAIEQMVSAEYAAGLGMVHVPDGRYDAPMDCATPLV